VGGVGFRVGCRGGDVGLADCKGVEIVPEEVARNEAALREVVEVLPSADDAG
jgi:hypothetical protein